MTLSDETLRLTVAEFEHQGRHQRRTADALGLRLSTLQHRLRRATERGIAEGLVAPRPLPVGQALSGISTLYGPDGSVTAQWIKSKAEPNLELLTNVLQETFNEYRAKPVLDYAPPSFASPDLICVYPIADLHLGMYAWAEETGNDYDLTIADKLLKDTMGALVDGSPSADTALILNLGDFFHSDSNENRTRRSGAALDVDTRYAKVLKIGIELMVHCVQLALQKHNRVIVRNLQGNHDPYAALALSLAMEWAFKGSDRVTVDVSPSPFFFHRFGKVLLGATHGDMAKLDDMPGIMAARQAKDWGETEYRYIYGGHWHTFKKWPSFEKAGAQVEVFQTLAPKDAWNNSMGFVSGRTMQSITHHAERGEVIRLTMAIGGPK